MNFKIFLITCLLLVSANIYSWPAHTWVPSSPLEVDGNGITVLSVSLPTSDLKIWFKGTHTSTGDKNYCYMAKSEKDLERAYALLLTAYVTKSPVCFYHTGSYYGNDIGLKS